MALLLLSRFALTAAQRRREGGHQIEISAEAGRAEREAFAQSGFGVVEL
jgi:hypothetical protein